MTIQVGDIFYAEVAYTEKPSWCRGKIFIKMSRHEAEQLVHNKSYIGRLLPEDFNFIIKEIEKLNR